MTLVEVIEAGDLEKLKRLIKQGADIHVDIEWSLHWAAYYGHLEISKYLLKMGAKIKWNTQCNTNTGLKHLYGDLM